MNDAIIMERLQSFEYIIGTLPDEVFANLLVFIDFTLYQTLNQHIFTAKSPPSAYYIKMQRVLPNSSKKADL